MDVRSRGDRSISLEVAALKEPLGRDGAIN